jgi:hypothetical protein
VACREPFRSLGGANPRAATRARAVEVFSSLGARVTEPIRDAKYEVARVKIANAAMIPSRVWDDTATWTSGTEARRTLAIGGRFAPPRFRLETGRTVPIPTRAAESRHIINLNKVGSDAYAWDTDVLYAIGSTPAADIAAFTRALFASAEGRDEAAVRVDFNVFAPRTTAAFGQIFSVDSIRTVHYADSSTLATFAVSLHPERVEARLPRFAEILKRYYSTARMRLTVVDHGGATYAEINAADGKLTLRVRTRRGEMVSLVGPARPMPDSLGLVGALTLKVRRFTIGIRDYRPEFTIIRTDHEAAWRFVSRKEPEWVLPLITERLLRTPLRRPFQGSGALWQIGVRDSTGGQTMLQRRLHLEVQESMILRFVGRLGATAVGDYQGLTEREQQLWLREVFEGIVADLAAFGGP